jgi:hypothetical protein
MVLKPTVDHLITNVIAVARDYYSMQGAEHRITLFVTCKN